MVKKRKLSAYNLHMKREMRKGKTFKQAVNSWNPKSKTRTKTRKITKSIKRRKVHRSSMARRKSYRSRARSSLSIGNIGNLLKKVGLAYAVGAGTSAAISQVGAIANVPQAQQIAPLAGAYAAIQTGGGIAGLAAAIPLAMQSGLLSGILPGTAGQAQGVGAFI